MTPPSSVSVLLVTRNGIATLADTLAAVRSQSASFPFEIIAVDSGSTDGTVELLADQADRVIRIPGREFNHGSTRNAGVAACRGELVALLVQDALPADSDWLARLVEPFADPRVAGSYARQEPRRAASAVTRHYLAGWAATAATPRLQQLGAPGDWDVLRPAERLDLCTFDNVCSCIRRRVWEPIPFPRVPIAEDVHWARAALFAGHRIAYAPAARVVHSHERSARHELRRTRAIHRELAGLCGLRAIPSLRHLLRAWASSLPLHARLTRGRRRELPRALALAVAFPLGQYLGGRDAERLRRTAACA